MTTAPTPLCVSKHLCGFGAVYYDATVMAFGSFSHSPANVALCKALPVLCAV